MAEQAQGLAQALALAQGPVEAVEALLPPVWPYTRLLGAWMPQ